MKEFVGIVDHAETPLNPADALDFVASPENGAGALFLGAVRNLNMGRDVLAVSYDVFAPLAEESFREICAEARDKWGAATNLYVAHAKGRLNVGDLSIVIAAGTPHRSESFAACRYVIEEIKKRSPIWKQEHYVDGDSEWVQGHALCQHAHDEDGHPHHEHA